MKNRLILSLIYLLIPTLFFGQNMKYQSFDNSRLSLEANSIRFFLQDEQGLIWIGSNKGLYSYDGYQSFPHFSPGSAESRMTTCGLFYEDDYILLGTNTGLLKYNYKYEKYEPFEIELSKDIRSMIHYGNDLWLGCSDGLYRYNFENGILYEMTVSRPESNYTGIIHALLEDRGYIYLEANGCLGRISTDDYKYEKIGNDTTSCGWMVNSFLKDEKRDCIWIGEGSNLTKYFPATNTFERVSGFPVVKTMEFDNDNNLVIGTDNGLYVYNEKETKHYVHNAQKSNSLANNIIWNIFKDDSGNMWLGTDFGISMAPGHLRFEFIPIFQFSGTSEGNQFYCIFQDSKKNYWLGGDNGLIKTRDINFVDEEIAWYKMGNTKNYIPHSHIRDIFEDNDNTLWIATDYGIGRYNYSTGRFSNHFILSKDSAFNSNWSYNILEDNSNNLWISSFNGGIFKISKDRLLESTRRNVSNEHYSTNDGLSSNNIDQIVFDKKGNIWALNHNSKVDILNTSTGEAVNFPILEHTGGRAPNFIMDDSQGNIWIGFRNGVVRIDPMNSETNIIAFEDADNALVMSLLQVGNNIWASSTEGLWVIDKDEYSVHHISIANQIFYSSYYNKEANEILLGGPNGIAVCSPEILNQPNENQEIIVSSILVNGERYINNGDEPAVRYNDKIELQHFQNNLVIEFSDLEYSKENRGKSYVYKVDDAENWTALKANENTILLNKLNPGNYKITIAERKSINASANTLSSFQLIITPPWYNTKLAQVIYALLLVGLIVWSINFFIQRNRLRFERIEREKTIEQTRLKIDFFTNIAHEFKTPLSLIIAPLSGLIHDVKNNKEEKDALEMIQQNALKLNSLVQQAIEYYRDDSKIPAGLVLSRIEFVEFSRSILSTYEDNMKERQIEFIFNSNTDKLFIDIDVLKIESIINNLLSNACKFTNKGDTIILSINYIAEDNNLKIKVSDTGIGIPEKDQPYIFQRFFQSPSNGGGEGTGIGLYLVKNFAELHGGSVSVHSNYEEGTSVMVQIPAVASNIAEPTPIESDNNIQSDEKPLIVIVEDNVAIANFIYNIFIPEFRCVSAGNGKKGLKICKDLKPDVIISDIMMPVMDGLEMCERLKKNVSTSTIPIILLTAKDDKETELRSINLKIDAFIAKPFDSSILYSRVKQLIEVKQQLGKKIRMEKLSTPVNGNTEVFSADEKFLAHITQIIEEQIDNPDLNVSFLCKEANIPQKQLYRKIKNLTGLTAVEYIKSIRIKKAAIFLSNKNFTIAEVMYKVGFSNHSYFAKCFSAEFGKTPRQFVEQ
ncbi:MAG TPA: ATP-binding protein [Draconibacterium sp.]|nr:ATP-binding protein [Draconibacterium sp.]